MTNSFSLLDRVIDQEEPQQSDVRCFERLPQIEWMNAETQDMWYCCWRRSCNTYSRVYKNLVNDGISYATVPTNCCTISSINSMCQSLFLYACSPPNQSFNGTWKDRCDSTPFRSILTHQPQQQQSKPATQILHPAARASPSIPSPCRYRWWASAKGRMQYRSTKGQAR